MADEQQLAVLRQGRDAWNAWREQNPRVSVDLYEAALSGADLSGARLHVAELSEANLSEANLNMANLKAANISMANLTEANLSRVQLPGANLSGADLTDANLNMANLIGANFSGAQLFRADLYGAQLFRADLIGADLSEANLFRADLTEANLSGVNLTMAHLAGASLIDVHLRNADLTGCRVYGVSAWNLDLEGARQNNLIITPNDEPEITVDNLEVAQFIYLLLNNERVRNVIDTITSKVVLILGRFTPERKVVLDALKEELRQRDYLPVLFDFDKPASKDLTGTVQTLANMARFGIADLTDPSSVPHELATVAPGIVVPVQPVLLEGQHEYAMFVDLKRRYHWVLEPHLYASRERLIADLSEHVIRPAAAKAEELRGVPPATG
jgi:hypothetical protein